MQITKVVFDQIKPGELFRIVRTRIQEVYDPMNMIMTFVCIKGKEGHDWAIYGAAGGGQPWDVARYGDKIMDKEHILSICPCDEEVLALYRH